MDNFLAAALSSHQTAARSAHGSAQAQGSLPSEDAAVVLLFSLVAGGPIKLRRIDGWRKIDAHPGGPLLPVLPELPPRPAPRLSPERPAGRRHVRGNGRQPVCPQGVQGP